MANSPRKFPNPSTATINVMENLITDLDSLALEIQSNYRAVSDAAGLVGNPYSEG